MKEHNIDYLCHDPEPYPCGDNPDVYGSIKDAGMFYPTKRTDGVSTSDLILRIVKDHEDYMWRSMQKKYTPEEIGISKEYAEHIRKKMMAKAKLEEAKKKGKDVSSVGDDIKKLQDELDKLSLATAEVAMSKQA